VCSGNTDRSPTAEEIFRNKEGLIVKSAGTLATAPVHISKELINWADIIFAMEEKHKKEIINMDSSATQKTIVLGIPDIYRKNQPELKQLIKEKTKPFLK
jgi:protein-tyrosine phosphatase